MEDWQAEDWEGAQEHRAPRVLKRDPPRASPGTLTRTLRDRAGAGPGSLAAPPNHATPRGAARCHWGPSLSNDVGGCTDVNAVTHAVACTRCADLYSMFEMYRLLRAQFLSENVEPPLVGKVRTSGFQQCAVRLWYCSFCLPV